MQKFWPVLRAVLGVLAGVIAGLLTITLADMISQAAFPAPPPPSDLSDKAAMKAFMALVPVGALATMAVGWILAAYLASMTALMVSGRVRWAGLAAAGLILAATVANLMMIPHPLWMAVLGVGGILAAAGLSDRLYAAKA
jgi:hypothetical protein